MKTIKGVSRWTNSQRAAAVHIDNGNGKPLCESKRKVFGWELDHSDPTCAKCKKLWESRT